MKINKNGVICFCSLNLISTCQYYTYLQTFSKHFHLSFLPTYVTKRNIFLSLVYLMCPDVIAEAHVLRRRRPSGVPEQDVCSGLVSYHKKQEEYMRLQLKKLQKENAGLAQKVQAGRESITHTEQRIAAGVEEWRVRDIPLIHSRSHSHNCVTTNSASPLLLRLQASLEDLEAVVSTLSSSEHFGSL